MRWIIRNGNSGCCFLGSIDTSRWPFLSAGCTSSWVWLSWCPVLSEGLYKSYWCKGTCYCKSWYEKWNKFQYIILVISKYSYISLLLWSLITKMLLRTCRVEGQTSCKHPAGRHAVRSPALGKHLDRSALANGLRLPKGRVSRREQSTTALASAGFYIVPKGQYLGWAEACPFWWRSGATVFKSSCCICWQALNFSKGQKCKETIAHKD